MKMYFVLGGRMPSRKAYGIQAAQTCASFIDAGIDLTLIIPRSIALREQASMKEFYGLHTDIPVTVLPGLDWEGRGRLGFILNAIIFMLSSYVYLFAQSLRGRVDVVYSIDMDTYSYILLAFLPVPFFGELHTPRSHTTLWRIFFAFARGVILLNPHIRDGYVQKLGVPSERLHVDPCAVDAAWLERSISREEARERLGIPHDVVVAAYVGRFYDWKGLEILPPAFTNMPDIDCYLVGGTAEQFKAATGVSSLPPNLKFPGECRNEDAPLWHAASDVLLVTWPPKQSPFYADTSPMKLFEYMAARRPIVAGNDRAVTGVAPDGTVLLYKLGDPNDLASCVRKAVADGEDIRQMVENAFATVRTHTLPERARRILQFISARMLA